MMPNYKSCNNIDKLNNQLQEKQGFMKLWLDIRKVLKIENYKIRKD